MSLKKEIQELKEEIKKAFKRVNNLEELEKMRIKYLGKKGEISEIFDQIGDVPPEQRPEIGRKTNNLKQTAEELHQDKKDILEQEKKQEKLKEEEIDITLPGNTPKMGYLHPLTQVINRIKEVFIGLGFSVAEGPEIENEYYNFEALNIPENHPARDLQDTLYVDNKYLLRTHTSPVQIRTMAKEDPPIRIIAPGRVYRSDELDASHSPVFHQVEGLVIDKDISFSDLKGTISIFVKEIYGDNRDIRFRPSYFPFTEPSAEVDVSCIVCGGDGCSACSYTGWIELLGSGMVHPNVLEMSGYDSTEYSGFAFGLGWDRIVLQKYGINDIRVLFENDKRFLHQF
ncbi:MAG: phenylalanine--tRNA ligase subunit alpha [Bacillota bacterium]